MAGDVVWRVQYGAFGAGDVLSDNVALVTGTHPAVDQSIVVTDIPLAATLVAGKALVTSLERLGADPGDTLGATAEVLDIRLKVAIA